MSLLSDVTGKITDKLNGSTGGLFGKLTGAISSAKNGPVTPDYRCKISAKPGGVGAVYGKKEKSNILYPLHMMGGLVFPYTPSVSFGANVAYEEYQFVHSIYRYNAYTRSAPNEITISGEFTAQTDNEAHYLLAVMHFLKSVTKSHFGSANAKDAGLPPPVLHFNYLGDNQFKNVPVIIKSYSYNLDAEVDYVQVSLSGGLGGGKNRNSWVPTKVNISVTVDTMYNPNMLRDQFDLEKFTQGKLIGNTGGTKEGFI